MYNLKLQKATDVITEKIDAKKFLENTDQVFDKILLDVPCSAEGRFYTQNPKSFAFWNTDMIQKKSELQKVLLDLAFSRLKQ